MFSRLASALLLTAAGASALHSQPTASPSIPQTPVGAMVKAWYDAYGSGDTARITDFYRKYQPERVERNTIQYRTGSGGFNILSIERAEPRHIEFLAREATRHRCITPAWTCPRRIHRESHRRSS